MPKNYPIEVLHWAGMTDNCLSDLQTIIEESPELINTCTTDGDNALIIASRVNNPAIVQYLVEETAINIAQKGYHGNAFLVAVKENHQNIAMYLAKNGVDIHAVNAEGKGAFHLAALNGNDDITEFLLEKNSNINLVDYRGENCLFSLIQNYTSHKNYWCFELMQSNMKPDILFKTNINGVNIIQYMDDLVLNSTNKIQQAVRTEQYNPLKNILLSRMHYHSQYTQNQSD